MMYVLQYEACWYGECEAIACGWLHIKLGKNSLMLL